jgi:hypothetical protein
VSHLQHADGREQEWACQATAEQLDRRVPRRDVTNIRGTIRQRSNASRFDRIVTSSPAPPAT